MQFALEYGCRLAPGGCYSILPSYRGETPDGTHLNQYTHSEVEIPGGLDDMVRYVDGYVKALATTVLDEHGDRIARARGTVAHVERMAARGAPFEASPSTRPYGSWATWTAVSAMTDHGARSPARESACS